MATFETRSRVGKDGKLHLSVPPSLVGQDVHVTVERAEPANEHASAARSPMSPEAWREFIRSTAGSMPEFPDVERPGPTEFDARDF